MPSANNNTRDGRGQFEAELLRMIDGLEESPVHCHVGAVQ